MNPVLTTQRQLVLRLTEVTSAPFTALTMGELLERWFKLKLIEQPNDLSVRHTPAFLATSDRFDLGTYAYSWKNDQTAYSRVILRALCKTESDIFHKVLIDGHNDDEVEKLLCSLDSIKEETNAEYPKNAKNKLKSGFSFFITLPEYFPELAKC